MKDDTAERLKSALLKLLTQLFESKKPELTVRMTSADEIRCEWFAGKMSGEFTLRANQQRPLNSQEIGGFLSVINKLNGEE